MSRFKTRHHLLSTLTLCTLFTSPHIFADEQTDEILVEPQALASALKEFSDQTGLQIAYVATLADNKSSPGTHGAATPADALDDLLNGTDLEHQFVNDETIAIGPAAILSTDEDQEPGKALPASSQVLMAQNQTSAMQNQTSSSETSNDDDVPLEIEQIIVTGSRIRGAQSASPVVTITRQEIERAGFSTVDEIVQKLPQNFGAGARQEGSNAGGFSSAVGDKVDDFTGGTSVNLRGLGASSTLVLFNGRRMSPSGRSASFTDISGIPVSAIERVEVLTDGASAIYGSDAIGGVINFITRDDYEGAETQLRYGSDSGGDTSEIVISQSFGKSWNGGNLLFSYEYYDHDNLAFSDRDFAASNDLTRFGGDDFRFDGGNPANIDAGGQLWAIPAGQDGTSLTAADFDPNAPPNRHSFLANGDMLPERKRQSAFLSLKQNIGAAELFADVRVSARDGLSRNTIGVFDFDVPGDDPLTPGVIEGNPFFVDPTGTGLTNVTVEGYSFVDDLGPKITDTESDSYNVALGVRFDMGENWQGELVGNLSKEDMSFRSKNFIDVDALDAAVNQTDPNLAFNPFADGSNTNSAVLDTLLSTKVEGAEVENELQGVGFNVNGSVFDIPGGPLQLAAGVDFREEKLTTQNATVNTDGFSTAIDDNRDVLAVYAELFFPLVSADNSRSGLRRLELSLAARYEDYSDFGDTTNPKVGIVWSPTQSLTLRGTWGTSFRAPQLTDLNAAASPSNVYGFIPQFFVDLGAFPTTILLLQGGNESLRGEEATTWTAGFEWNPEGVKGLSLDMTYFNVDFEDRIDTPFTSIFDGLLPRFSSLFTQNPGDPQDPAWLARVASLANDPRYVPAVFGIPTSAADLTSGAAPVGAIMDRRINNLSQSVVTGVELQFLYTFDTSAGAFDIGLNGNYLFDYERALLATDPLVEEVDTFGRPVDFRARGSVTWNRNAWTVSGFVNYTDGYTDAANDPARPVDSWTTVDLTISYDTGEGGGFLRDTRIALTTQNLFDEDPPFVNNFGLSYDLANASGLGRFLALQVTKEW